MLLVTATTLFTNPDLFQQLLFAAKAPASPRPVEGTASPHRPGAAAEQLALREVASEAGDFGHEKRGEGSHPSPQRLCGFTNHAVPWCGNRVHGWGRDV